jgi:hypothetical protein
VKKFIPILAGIVIAANVFLAGPAEAALPVTEPTRVIHCGTKAALVWQETRHVDRVVDGELYEELAFTTLAAVNPCREWLEISWGGDPNRPKPEFSSLFLAPGKKFNWDEWQISKYRADTPVWYTGYTELVSPKQVCAPKSYNFAKKVYKYNDVRSVGDCKGVDPKLSHTVTASCMDDEQATLTWKMDGKRITKIAVENECDTEDLPMYTAVWWRYKYGTAAIFTGGKKSTDLWKAELDGLPLDTIDGKVHFMTDTDDDDAFTYTWYGNGDFVGCWAGDGGCPWRR